MKRVLHHIFSSRSFQRQFEIVDATSPSQEQFLDLRKQLSVVLSSEMNSISFERLKKRNQSYGYIRAALVCGATSAIVAFTTSAYIIQLIAEKEQTFQLDWIRIPLFLCPLFAAVAGWGWLASRKLSQDTFDPLHSNGQRIFLNSEMEERWALFLKWATEHKPIIWILQNDGTECRLADGFWSLPNNELFVLGDGSHRKELLIDNWKLTSELMITESDWKSFEDFLIKHNESEKEVHIPEPENSNGKEKPLSLRQEKFGTGTKRTPRFQLLVTHPQFKNRYTKDVTFESNEANDACHRALLLILKNDEHKRLDTVTQPVTDLTTPSTCWVPRKAGAQRFTAKISRRRFSVSLVNLFLPSRPQANLLRMAVHATSWEHISPSCPQHLWPAEHAEALLTPRQGLLDRLNRKELCPC